MGFIRDWIRKKDEARLKKLVEARVAEGRRAADAVRNNPDYALDLESEPGVVTAQYGHVKAALDDAKQAKREARSSARRVLGLTKKIKGK